MRILLIKPKQIGDSLILTPTIRAIKQAHPDADIWVMVRKGCEGILAGCPDITRILTLAGVEKSERKRSDVWHQIGVLLQLWAVSFDYVFELGDGHRARLFAMLTRAKRRYSVKTSSPMKPIEAKRFTGISTFEWATCHRIEKDFYTVSQFLPLSEPIPPMIFEPDAIGSISAEHGLGTMKSAEALAYKSAAEVETLRAIRKALDPKRIMNPRVLF